MTNIINPLESISNAQNVLDSQFELDPLPNEPEARLFSRYLKPTFDQIIGDAINLDKIDTRMLIRSAAVYGGEDVIKSNPKLLAHFLPYYKTSGDTRASYEQIATYRQQTYMPNLLSDIIDQVVGHIFREPPIIRPTAQRGRDLEFFNRFIESSTPMQESLMAVIQKSLKDIFVYGKTIHYLDEIVDGSDRYPTLMTINFDQVQEWKVSQGKLAYLELRPVRQDVQDDTTNRVRTYYRQDVFFANPYRLVTYELTEDMQGVRIIGERPILINGVEVQDMPIYMIGIEGLSYDKEKPVYNNAVNTISALYRIMADYYNNLRLSAAPMLVIKSNATSVRDQAASNVRISPNFVLSLTENDTAEFLEIKGKSIESLRQQVDDLLRMLQDTAIPALGAAAGAESGMALSIKANSQSGFMKKAADCVSCSFEAMCNDIGELYGLNSTVEIQFSNNFMLGTIDPNSLPHLAMMLKEGLITEEIYIYNLKRSGLLPSNIDTNELREILIQNLQNMRDERAQELDNQRVAAEREQNEQVEEDRELPDTAEEAEARRRRQEQEDS